MPPIRRTVNSKPKKYGGSALRKFAPPEGVPPLGQVRKEMNEYVSVLMGRQDSPFDNGVATLAEYASIVLARGLEIQMRLHRAEADGNVSRGDPWYIYRTGELRDFIELAKSAYDIGSRRVTVAQMEVQLKEFG